jgi:cobalamin biosynthesis protein CbiG
MNVKFPEVSVTLVGTDGSSLAVVGAVIRALRRAGIKPRAIDDYQAEALSGDYNHLLQVTMATVDVE